MNTKHNRNAVLRANRIIRATPTQRGSQWFGPCEICLKWAHHLWSIKSPKSDIMAHAECAAMAMSAGERAQIDAWRYIHGEAISNPYAPGTLEADYWLTEFHRANDVIRRTIDGDSQYRNSP